MTISIRKCYAAGGSAIDEWDMEMNGCSVRRTCGESDCTPALPEGVMREIIHIVDHENDGPRRSAHLEHVEKVGKLCRPSSVMVETWLGPGEPFSLSDWQNLPEKFECLPNCWGVRDPRDVSLYWKIVPQMAMPLMVQSALTGRQSYVWAVADLINDQSSCISACLANYLGCELRRSVEKRYVEKTKSWRRTDDQMVAWVNFISVENSGVSMKNLELTVIPDHPNMRWDGWTEWQWPLDITRKVADIIIGGPVARKMFAQRRTANKPALCASPCAFAFGKGFTVSSL